MPSLPAIPHVPREVLVAIGAVLALLVVWLSVRSGRRRDSVVIKKSEVGGAIAFELSRIADALERLTDLAAPRETRAPSEEREHSPQQRLNWMSLFRR